MNKLEYKLLKNLNKEILEKLISENIYESSFENSRFKKNWNNFLENPPENYLFCLCLDNNKIIGIGLIEPFINKEFNCLNLKNPFATNGKLKHIYEEKININGWIQFYVKNEYRKNGIALKMSTLLQIEGKNKYENSVLFARGDAIEIAKNTQNIPIIDKTETNFYFLNAIHFVTDILKENKLLKIKENDVSRKNYFKN